MKTLIVEDDDLMRRLFETLLSARGHEVFSYADAESALESHRQHGQSLILLDWMLAGMDGLELCRLLRARPGGDACVILVITARNRPEDLLQALQAGADDYLAKPLDPELLLVRLMIAEQRVHSRLERLHVQARLAETLRALEGSHDDLRAILNLLKVGSAITDESGQVTFVSELARRLFLVGASGRAAPRSHWTTLLPVTDHVRALLERQLEQPEGCRSSVPIQVENARKEHYSVESEIHDDPRDPRRKIFLFYDVTEIHDLRRQLDHGTRFHELIGASEAMHRVYGLIRDVAEVDVTVLIEGETGTGKELVARAIHARSPRREKPFIAVNCAGLTDSILTSQLFGHRRGAFTGAIQDSVGLFEAAHGGTLFLDEIGDIPMNVQTALLRVLQEKEITRVGETRSRKIDVRVLCATHRDLAEEVNRGTFRMDLLYRIRVARIQLPALRQRMEDIPVLVAAFLAQARAATGKAASHLSQDAMRRLLEYPWPGNVRELKSAIEFAVIRSKSPVILEEDLAEELHRVPRPFSPRPVPSPGASPETERSRYLEAIRAAGGNRAAAARLLGISRATFYRHLERLGLGEPGGGAME